MTDQPRLGRAALKRLAHTLCDADCTLENFKHGYSCRRGGCLTVPDECAAYRQARAVARLLPELTTVVPVLSSRERGDCHASTSDGDRARAACRAGAR